MLVLLDGGPSRAFAHTDIAKIEEDLNMLKVKASSTIQGMSVLGTFFYCHSILLQFYWMSQCITD